MQALHWLRQMWKLWTRLWLWSCLRSGRPNQLLLIRIHYIQSLFFTVVEVAAVVVLTDDPGWHWEYHALNSTHTVPDAQANMRD
jgi:hypothetical protein